MRHVLVTGTSRGIGRATASRLAAAGLHVLAAARREQDAPSAPPGAPGHIQPLVLDLRDDASLARAAESVAAAVGDDGLFGLVNNAAGGSRGSAMEYVTRPLLEASFEVTAFGTVLLSRELLPLLRRARGRVVNVGAGRLPLPLMGPGYGAKLAMEAMSDVLRLELRRTGVRVSIVEPGMTRWEDVDEQLATYDRGMDEALGDVSPGDRGRFEAAVRGFKALNRRMMRTAAPADRVAATIERALTARRPRVRYHCGWEQRVVAWMERLTTERFRDAVVARVTGL